MGRSLVIVESPAKAKTINKYLGRDYTVKASIGHVMDLPKKTIGIRLPDEPKKKKKGKGKKGKAAPEKPQKPITLDDAKIFEPTLQIISGKGKVINDLRKSANTADAVYLAGDPDREGEAISAHLAMVLSKPSNMRKPSHREMAGLARTGRTDAEAGKKKRRGRSQSRQKARKARIRTRSRSRRSIRRRFSASHLTRLRRRRSARRLRSRGRWTPTWWTRSRRAGY